MEKSKTPGATRKAQRLAFVTGVTGQVSFMHPEDVGALVARGSQRTGCKLRPNYAANEDGVDTVKVLMATDTLIMFESFRPKGAVDTVHAHPDRHSVVYQKLGRTLMRIDDACWLVGGGWVRSGTASSLGAAKLWPSIQSIRMHTRQVAALLERSVDPRGA